MGTASIAPGGTVGFPSPLYGRGSPASVTVVWSTADWIAAEGGALVAGDILQLINVPAGTCILGATLQVETADTATAATLDVGLAGGDALYDGADATTAAFPALGTNGQVANVIVTAADTIDVILKTLTGTAAGGVFRLTVFLGNGTDPDTSVVSVSTPA